MTGKERCKLYNYLKSISADKLYEFLILVYFKSMNAYFYY